MTALLTSWLAGPAYPVLNWPAPACLMGLSWRLEKWIYAASQIGSTVSLDRRRAALGSDRSTELPKRHTSTIAIAGDRHFGKVGRTLSAQAQGLLTYY